jgi:hypothetical protein
MCKVVIEWPVALKTCPKCGVAKTVSEFCKAGNRPSGLGCWCKECNAAYAKRWFKKNKARGFAIIPEIKTCPRCKNKKPSSGFTKSSKENSLLSFGEIT